MSLMGWQFSISSASPNDHGDIKKMPAIQMDLLHSYRYDEILQAARRYQYRDDFLEAFPAILKEESTSWFLWNAKIEIDRLTLSYFCREGIRDGDADFGYHTRYGIGEVIVQDPMVLGLRFTMPDNIGGKSNYVYECMMSSSGTGHSHNLQLTERQPSGRSTTLSLSTTQA